MPPTPISPEATSRDSKVVERAEKGESLSDLAKEHNVSRERIRQIVASGSTMSPSDLEEARRTYRKARREEKVQTVVATIHAVAAERPDASIDEIVEVVGHPASTVVRTLGPIERDRRGMQGRPTTSIPDGTIFAALRASAVQYANGTPLTMRMYDMSRAPGTVSSTRVVQRFGTWVAACNAAGVEAQKPNPNRVYAKKWSNDEMLGWVQNFLTEHPSGSYSQFEQWLREHRDDNAPSAQTLRNALGTWQSMKSAAARQVSTSVA